MSVPRRDPSRGRRRADLVNRLHASRRHDRTFLENVCTTVVDLDPMHLGVDGEGGNRFSAVTPTTCTPSGVASPVGGGVPRAPGGAQPASPCGVHDCPRRRPQPAARDGDKLAYDGHGQRWRARSAGGPVRSRDQQVLTVGHIEPRHLQPTRHPKAPSEDRPTATAGGQRAGARRRARGCVAAVARDGGRREPRPVAAQALGRRDARVVGRGSLTANLPFPPQRKTLRPKERSEGLSLSDFGISPCAC